MFNRIKGFETEKYSLKKFFPNIWKIFNRIFFVTTRDKYSKINFLELWPQKSFKKQLQTDSGVSPINVQPSPDS